MLGLSLLVASCLIFVARFYLSNYSAGGYIETKGDDDAIIIEGQTAESSHAKTTELEVLLN